MCLMPQYDQKGNGKKKIMFYLFSDAIAYVWTVFDIMLIVRDSIAFQTRVPSLIVKRHSNQPTVSLTKP